MKVDICAIEATMKATKNCIKEHESNIKNENSIIEQICDSWQGDDAETFVKKWNEITKKNNSPEKIYKEQLNEYYNYLKKAKELYEEMQKNLKSMANGLNY